jgi:hypothetical protein
MNWSLRTADRATHGRIVAVALLGATIVAIAAISAQRAALPVPASTLQLLVPILPDR